jgi:hypothetical protein
MSVWLSQASLTATVISSPLAIVVEVFDVVSQTLRTIPLARNIDDAKAFTATVSTSLLDLCACVRVCVCVYVCVRVCCSKGMRERMVCVLGNITRASSSHHHTIASV